MTTDQVVAALAAEGYNRDRIRAVIDSFADIPWRQSDRWNEQEIGALRRELGSPENGPDLSFDLDSWAADLGYIIWRTTGGRTTLDIDQLRHIAGELLHQCADADWLPEATKVRLNEHGEVPGQYDPDFTVGQWTLDLGEATRRGTGGELQLSHAELQVAANLLLHASEGDWIPQAARIRQDYEPGRHRTY
jgi:transposase